MYQSSTEYRTQLRQSGTRHYFLVELYSGDALIGSSDPGTGFDIFVSNGRARCDINGRYRRTCTLDLVVSAGNQATYQSLMGAESSSEIKIWRGIFIPGGVGTPAPQARYIAYPGGTLELYPMGMFHPSTFEIEVLEDGNVTIHYEGVDRSEYLDKNFGQVYTVSATTSYWDAALNIVSTFINCPNSYTTFIDTGAPTWGSTPRLVFSNSDNIWDAIIELARGINKEPIWDPHGVFAFRSLPDYATSPTEDSFLQTSSEIILHQKSKRQDALNVINTVDVVGNAPWLLFPVSGRASVSNPAVLWSTANIGFRVKTIENSIVTSTAQAEDIAEKELLKWAGIPEHVEFLTIPDPRFEANDIVVVTSTGANLSNAKCIVDSFEVPLTYAEPMSWNCRRLEQ